MSLLQSGRFNFAFACFGIFGSIGVTLMTTGHLWFGLGMVLLGVFVPLPFYWSHLRRIRIGLAPGEPIEGERVDRLPTDLWGYFAVVGIAVMVGGYVFLSESVKGKQREVAELETQLADLQKQFGSRRIPQGVKDRLVPRLRGQGTGYILTITTLKDRTTDSAKYAEDFIEVFERAGWKPQVERLDSVTENVWIHARPDLPPVAFLLSQFRQPDVSIEAQFYPIEDESWEKKKINLIIGPRQVR